MLLCQTVEHYMRILTDIKAPLPFDLESHILDNRLSNTKNANKTNSSTYRVIVSGGCERCAWPRALHVFSTQVSYYLYFWNLSICTQPHEDLGNFFPRLLWPVVISGHRERCAHLEHLLLFSTEVSPCLFFWYLNICSDTHFFRRSPHFFSEFFALQQVGLFPLSSPSSTYPLLCDAHTVACHHLKPSWEVRSMSSTCIFFQSRSVTVCLLVFKHMYSIDNHLFEDSYTFFLKFWPCGERTTGL